MKEKNVNPEDLDLKLPSSIIDQSMDEDDDSDMPLPETAEYADPHASDNKILIPTAKFYKLFNECMGKLPYASIIKNEKNDQIKLVDLFNYVEMRNSTGISVKEMNAIISFVANAPFEFVRPFMEIVNEADRQKELWTLKS